MIGRIKWWLAIRRLRKIVKGLPPGFERIFTGDVRIESTRYRP